MLGIRKPRKVKAGNLKMVVDCGELDAAIEKAKRLNELLGEAEQLKKEISKIKVSVEIE